MRSSDKTGKLMTALAKAQAQLEDPKQAQKGHHGTYASLADGLPGARRVLASHGVALMQAVDIEARSLVTRLACGDEWLEGDYPLIFNDREPQKQGSMCTYARRYALWSMLGLAPEDDDAQGANDSKGNSRQRRPPPQRSSPEAPLDLPYTEQVPRDHSAWAGWVRSLEPIGWTVEGVAHFLAWSGGKQKPWEMSHDGRFQLAQKLAEPTPDLRAKLVAWEAERGM